MSQVSRMQKGRKWHYRSAEAANARLPKSSNVRQLIVIDEEEVSRDFASLSLELAPAIGAATATCKLHSKNESEDSATSSKTSATSVFGDGVQEMAAIGGRVKSKKQQSLEEMWARMQKRVIRLQP